jgi:hypothetical protein
MKYSDVDSVCNILVDMFDEKPQLVKNFKMKGVEYGFIPFYCLVAMSRNN